MTTLRDEAGEWIRDHLEALEEEIISAYIARAQFARNEAAYSGGYLGNPDQSLFGAYLLGLEEFNAGFGRYRDPLERPFNDGLPEPKELVVVQNRGLKISDYDSVSVTPEIKEAYLEFLDVICQPGDDKQYGSSAEHDTTALLVTSQRIHSGMIVAEWKYGENPEMYDRLIQAKDEAGLEDALTNESIENKVIARVQSMAQQRRDAADPAIRHVIEPDEFVHYFKESIMRLTKVVEVAYFLNRTQTHTD